MDIFCFMEKALLCKSVKFSEETKSEIHDEDE